MPYIDFLNVGRFQSKEGGLGNYRRSFDHKNTPLQVAMKLTEYVNKNFKYVSGITSVESTIEEVWVLKACVCRILHILLVMLRMLGIPFEICERLYMSE